MCSLMSVSVENISVKRAASNELNGTETFKGSTDSVMTLQIEMYPPPPAPSPPKKGGKKVEGENETSGPNPNPNLKGHKLQRQNCNNSLKRHRKADLPLRNCF